MFTKIFFIANNTIHHEGLSGGDRIYIELARRWSRQTPLVLVGPEETFLLARREGLKSIEFHQTCPRIPHGDDHTLGTLFRNFFKKLFCGVRYVRRHSGLFKRDIAVYSASDFYPDVIPAWLIKLMNPKACWIAGFYLFAPSPWQKDSPYKGILWFRGFLYWLSQKAAYVIIDRWADLVFVTSEPDVERFLNEKRDRSRVLVVQGGVDVAPSTLALNASQIRPAQDRAYDAVFIGRFHAQKGVIQLVDIWSRVARRRASARLAMIGDGPLRPEVERKIKELHLEDHIVLTGFLDGPPKYDIFKDSRVVVHPATYDSGGMAAAEAMAWGLPGVSYDLEALKTYYPQGMIKVPLENIESFVQAVLDLLEKPELYRKVGQEARDLIVKVWDWDERARTLWSSIEDARKSEETTQGSKVFQTLETLDERRRFITRSYDTVARTREAWIRRRRYYYEYLAKVLRFLVVPGRRVLQIKCETGFYLEAVRPLAGMGLDYSDAMVREARRLRPAHTFEVQDLERPSVQGPFDEILCVNALGDIVDVQRLLTNLKRATTRSTRLIIVNYNAVWQPLIVLANRLHLKIHQPTQNWLSPDDIRGILYLSGYEIVKSFNVVLCPVWIPFVSWFLNDIVARLPFFQKICLDHVFVARALPSENVEKSFSVSVVVPCRNEVGNIASIVQRMPEMGRGTELIFSDDRSTDKTTDEVRRLMALHPHKRIKLVDGPGICKSKNVWNGFDHATGDILMIFDADSTVIPEELPYFYDALVQGKGDFINGSRLVYPMAEDAMPFHKMLGNKMFSVLFSYVLGQRVKDTLCGTKVFWRDDYERMKAFFGAWGPLDRWGDYDLLFSATKINLKIVDLPVHYFERIHGATKMRSVVTNGTRMMAMVLVALKKLRFF